MCVNWRMNSKLENLIKRYITTRDELLPEVMTPSENDPVTVVQGDFTYQKLAVNKHCRFCFPLLQIYTSSTVLQLAVGIWVV